MATLGLATVAQVTVRYTELPDMVEHVINLPVTVNVVPGDVAAGRVPDPVVMVERLLQQAQQSKRDSISSLRAGEAATAQDLLAGAMDQLHADFGEMAPEDRALLDEEVGELRRLRVLTGQGNTERTVKSSYASMSQRSRSRRPSPTPAASACTSTTPPTCAPTSPNPGATEDLSAERCD